MSKRKTQLLGISGSLRRHSSNTVLLHAIAALMPGDVSLTLCIELDSLPFFNPDIETETALQRVQAFRQQVADADGVILSTPEYAFGMPGVLKNALDWLVSSGEMNQKPVVAISASPLHSGGDKALSSLLSTLTALGTDMTGRSSCSIPAAYQKIDPQGGIVDAETAGMLASMVNELCEKVLKKWEG